MVQSVSLAQEGATFSFILTEALVDCLLAKHEAPPL